MSHLFLPSDPALKLLAAQIEEERNHALTLEPAGELVAERAERSAPDEAFRALWSSARRDDEVLQTTQPGEALALFAEAAPEPTPTLVAFTTTEPAPQERRERLREQRRALVAVVARATGEEHRIVNARLNRAVGAASVAKSTAEQLEKANALLEKEIARRRL